MTIRQGFQQDHMEAAIQHKLSMVIQHLIDSTVPNIIVQVAILVNMFTF